MAKKIILEQFTGVTPRVPNHALPDRAASSAINARLSDNTIRPFYEPVDSVDANSDLSSNFDGYTNFFKASTDDTLAWMSWTVDRNISVLEVRYNDIDRYDYPTAPEASAEGGVLSVFLSGPTVALVGDNEYVAAVTYTVQTNETPGEATIVNQTQQVTATLEFTLDTISTYAWAYVSGDAAIVIDTDSIADPTFTNPSLAAPAVIGTTETASAVWEVTITDNSANVGTRQITVTFGYAWEPLPTATTGGGGGGVENDDYYYDMK